MAQAQNTKLSQNQQQPRRYAYPAQAGIIRPSLGKLQLNETFKYMPDGRIACFGLGPVNCTTDDLDSDQNMSVTCLAFQKVDTGVVNALLPVDHFIPIDWPDRPSHQRGAPYVNPWAVRNQHRLHLGQGGFPPVLPIWQDFTQIMAAARHQYLNHMPVLNGREQVVCDTMYEANLKGTWDSLLDDQLSKLEQIITGISPQFPYINTPAYQPVEQMIQAMCDDFDEGTPVFNFLMPYLFPNFKRPGQKRRIVRANTSNNVPLTMGATHCLVYGFHEMQQPENRGRPRVRAPVNHRVALRKALGSISRSRSRSGSRSPVCGEPDPDIYHDMVDINTGERPANDLAVIDNPDQYIVSPYHHHHYFESHRPHAVVYHSQATQDIDTQEQRASGQAKIVFELSTSKKYGTSYLFETTIRYSTEQCVQCCLAALGFDQNEILGIVVVADGMKLIKVNKVMVQGQPLSYKVTESDLIMWDNANALHEMFHIINNVL